MRHGVRVGQGFPLTKSKASFDVLLVVNSVTWAYRKICFILKYKVNIRTCCGCFHSITLIRKTIYCWCGMEYFEVPISHDYEVEWCQEKWDKTVATAFVSMSWQQQSENKNIWLPYLLLLWFMRKKLRQMRIGTITCRDGEPQHHVGKTTQSSTSYCT